MAQSMFNPETRVSVQTREKAVFKVVVVAFWLLLLWLLFPLMSYESPSAEIWNRYSRSFASFLIVYANLLIFWPLLLGLSGQYIDRLSNTLQEMRYPRTHIQFSAACVCVSLLIWMIMNLWNWGQDYRIRLGILFLGLWLSVLPTFWNWGLKGWPVRTMSISYIFSWMRQNTYLWLRPLVAGGVVLLGTGLAFMSSENYWLLAILLVPMAGLGWIIWRWRVLGVVGLIPASLIIPIKINTGSEFSQPNATVMLLLLLSGFWALDMIYAHKVQLPRSAIVWPLLIFAIVVVFAFGFGQLSWYPVTPASTSAQIGGTMIFILSFAALFLVAHYIKELGWLEWMTWLFIALGSLYMISLLWPWLGEQIAPLPEPPMRPWQEHAGRFQPGSDGSMFWTWLVALSFSQAAFNNRLHLFWRLLIGSVTLMTLYCALFLNRGWVSGYAPALVALLATLWFAAPKLGLLTTLLGAIGGAVKLAQILNEVVFIGDNSYSLATRHDAWLIVLQLASINPILGLGPANYYFYTQLIPIRGHFVRFNSHSQYVDLIAQTGVLGIACFFWVLGTIGWIGWKLRTQVPQGFARAYVYGVLGGLAGTVVAAVLGDWVLPFTYNVGIDGFRASTFAWLFMGGLVALEQMRLRADSTLAKEEI